MRQGLPSIVSYMRHKTHKKMFPEQSIHYIDSVNIGWARGKSPSNSGISAATSASPVRRSPSRSREPRAVQTSLDRYSPPARPSVNPVFERRREPQSLAEVQIPDSMTRRPRAEPVGEEKAMPAIRKCVDETRCESPSHPPNASTNESSSPPVSASESISPPRSSTKESASRRKSSSGCYVRDEWDLIMKHRARMAARERQREQLTQKVQRQRYSEELAKQLELKKASSVSESYEKRVTQEIMRQRTKELERLEQLRRLEERRMKDATRKFYDLQVTERRCALQRSTIDPQSCNASVDGIMQTMGSEERRYRRRLEEANRRQGVLYRRYINQMMPEIEGEPGKNASNVSLIESVSTSTRTGEMGGQPAEEKRQTQQQYRDLLDYQAAVQRQIERQRRSLSPEVVKMNRREIEVLAYKLNCGIGVAGGGMRCWQQREVPGGD